MALEVERLADGLWRWTCPHPEWDGATDWPEVVGSVYCETPAAIAVIDPLVPADAGDRARFWRAFDGDVARLGRPVVVLLTCRWHARSAADFAARHGARVWGPAADGHAFAGLVTDVVADGAEPVPGIVALTLGSLPPNEECLYLIPAHATLVAGDVVGTGADGTLHLAEPAWYANSPEEEEWYRRRARPTLAAMARHTVERILVGHGPPVVAGGAAMLRALDA